MTLTSCAACKHMISTSAASCPQCGHPQTSSSSSGSPETIAGAATAAIGAVNGFVYKIAKVMSGIFLLFLFAAVLSNPRGFVPWSLKAERAGRVTFGGESGDNIAATIQKISHPTGHSPRRRDVDISLHDDILIARMTVTWVGGILGGNYETTVQWRCNQERDLGIEILGDTALTSISNENFRKLQDYFESEVYRVVRENAAMSPLPDQRKYHQGE